MEPIPCSANNSAILSVLQSDTLVRAIQRELQARYPGQQLSTSAIRNVLKTLVGTTAPADDEPRKPISSYFTSGADVEEALFDILRYDMVYSAFGG